MQGRPSFFCVIDFLQIFTELVGGGQVLFAKVVRRVATANVQLARDLPAEVVSHEVECGVRARGGLLAGIGHRGDERGLLFAHQRGVVGIKTVDDGLDLGVDVEIIDRRDEDDRVGLEKVRIELLHVVSRECALTGADALVAADAGVHVLERRVEAEDLVSRAFRAALELIGQRSGRAMPVRAAGDDDDFHIAILHPWN